VTGAAPVVRDLGALPDHSADPDQRRATVSVLVEGWPEDAGRCLAALDRYCPPDVALQVLDISPGDCAAVVDEFAAAGGRRPVRAWHLRSRVGWSAARRALLRADEARFHVWCEPSTVLDGDAITSLLAAFTADDVVGAGWQGVDVDLDDAWRSVRPAGPGEVDAVLGYLAAFRRAAALAVGGPHPKARFYRNADVEFSFMLRAAGGRLVVPAGPLPCHQTRHHGYLDSDPAYRDRESERTYRRFLAAYRGREDLLARRSGR
jgi:GT2 family glycosyltransferase